MAIYDHAVKSLMGEPVDLGQYRGKVLLIVNTASKCGFTPQYKGLEELYRRHKDRGLVVMGFPCNQFGAQEPGTPTEIKEFCEVGYDTTFPMFEKVDVNGDAAHPLWVELKEAAPGLLGTKGIKWNFTKFLVDRSGRVVNRFAPQTSPGDLEDEVKALL